MELCFTSTKQIPVSLICNIFSRLLNTNVRVQQLGNMYVVTCNRNYDILKKIKRGVYVQLGEFDFVFVTHYVQSKL